MAVATTTSIADLPDWQKQYATDILSRAQALGRQDYTLPAYQVAARSPMQQQASQLAVQGIGAYQPMLQAGAGTVGSGVETMRAALDPLSASIQSAGQIGSQTAANIMDPTGVQAFMSPYEQAVIDQSMQDIRRAGDIAMQGTRAQAVGAGAFGGSRSGIAEQELNRNVLEQQARTAAQLRASGFQQAQQQQLQRAQAAGQVGLQGAQLMQSGAGQYGTSWRSPAGFEPERHQHLALARRSGTGPATGHPRRAAPDAVPECHDALPAAGILQRRLPRDADGAADVYAATNA